MTNNESAPHIFHLLVGRIQTEVSSSTLKLTTQDVPDGSSENQIFINNLPLCVVNIKTSD
jgi:hypothetical protein